MLIDQIVSFCHEELQNKNCSGCQNIHHCNRNCKTCLDDLHFHKNLIRDDYNCEHLLDYYVCRYSYKYCSEMIYALEQVDLSSFPYLNILSLGCGGAADLMAFDYMKYSKKIAYAGFDRNPSWEKIHNRIEKQYEDRSVVFYRGIDVLKYFDTHTIPRCNVLSIEYLISFFYKTLGKDGMRDWFKTLVEKIIQLKPENSPLLVIINDVDSINTGRDTFVFLRNIIEECGLHIDLELKMRFKPVAHYPDSIQYPSKQNKFVIPQFIKENYCPAINCESAQLILEVR